MDEVVSSWRSVADLLGFINAVAITLILLYASQQVRVAKRDLRLRNERAAKEHAIEYASRWLNEYVPLGSKFVREFAAAGLTPYTGVIGDFSRSSLPAETIANTNSRLASSTWLPAMNELLAISSAFVSGVADERTGFGIIGRSFCVDVAEHYDIISYYRKDAAHPVFQSIVDLYVIWRSRLSKAEFLAAREQLDRQIDHLPDRGIRPLGM